MAYWASEILVLVNASWRVVTLKLDLTGKIDIEGKTRQNAENKQTLDLTGKIEIEGKTRQNAENKQTFGLTGK